MPQTKSAKKTLKQSKRRRLTNLAILKKLKTAVLKFKKKSDQTNFIQLQSLADLAARKKVISKNRAARLKSNLAKILPKIKNLKEKRLLTKRLRVSSLNKTKR